jgi:hypothetical protein
MTVSAGDRFDFFLSRRGSVAGVAREVADVLTDKGYRVLVQDYDIPIGASFVEAMHEAVMNSRDLIVLFTEDYLRSPYTRKEFTSFEAERARSPVRLLSTGENVRFPFSFALERVEEVSTGTQPRPPPLSTSVSTRGSAGGGWCGPSSRDINVLKLNNQRSIIDVAFAF